jgi:dienelactone hydrolase
MKRTHVIVSIVVAVALLATAAAQETVPPQYPTVAHRGVEIWSDGTRLAGDLFYPRHRSDEDSFPAIVMCNGWGGLKRELNVATAPEIAAAGFFVLTFDYRGWGESDSRLVVRGEMPEPDENLQVTVRAQAIRELVDPVDQQMDIENAISFIEGEPGVDRNLIGLWGTSFGGGHVVWRAAHDDRVRCIASQVGSMPPTMTGPQLPFLLGKRVQRARGELDPVPQGENQVPGLQGTAYFSRMALFGPGDHFDKVTIPVLLIDAENEELFDRRKMGGRAYEMLQGRVPVKYHILKGATHYDVYGSHRVEATQLEIDWYNEHLNPRRAPVFAAANTIFLEDIEVSLASTGRPGEIRYTLDGSDPAETSAVYDGPITVSDTTTFMARTFWPDGRSNIGTFTVSRVEPVAPVDAEAAQSGRVAYQYYEGTWEQLPEFDSLEPVSAGTIENFLLTPSPRQEFFGMRFRGFLTVPESGVYTFHLGSNDGSKLLIHDRVVIDNDGSHAEQERSGSIALDAGTHPITVLYFQGPGRTQLVVDYEGPGFERRKVPSQALSSD